ncbi:AAA family ATPase [Mastigocoleus sp. MO_188.B34]|uniref:ATP-dependent nuclease n=1 Tax=Mastigocoleus sp. MO_188.B34 TaxID=3036635 RepID=UPI002630B68E|nr:AAA family ATPase [Mastigocoleus sp. MO_188.B34]MDJ0692903.1 AAA family ATPase [Mastigocoleus sp. MO_188.B34]
MRLVNFSVTNFRSITTAHKIAISNTTILIGKNNEGKSNILKALSIAMKVLQEHAAPGRFLFSRARIKYRNDESFYLWERDFPINFQKRKQGNQSIFRLEFDLDEKEVIEFKDTIKSNLNGTLPIEIKFSKEKKPSIKVCKSGKGSKTLNSKSTQIADFIAKKISFNYIPAIRTDKKVLRVIDSMLSQELRILEKEQTYQKALDTIKKLQQPLLNKLAEKIKEPLSEFLPNMTEVKIDIPEQERRTALRKKFNVIIDDGTPTNIEFKGDGVKSLAALALLKNRYLEGSASIVAIEEPESHLHPAAIHQLTEIINSLATTSQVIITTHNPLFVDRHSLKSNVIIDNGKASSARSIKAIREILGVKASDNLINANYALVVEGEEDAIALKSLLPFLSEKLAKFMKNNLLVIEPIRGAGNLSYKLSLLNSSLCVYHVLLDNDDAGRKSYDKASKEGLVTVKNCTMINCLGMSNSEFEDCLDISVYKQKIYDKFGVNLKDNKFRCKLKWSERIKSVFLDTGKPWNETIEKEVKRVVSQCVARNPGASLNTHKRSSLDALVSALETLVKI